MGAADPGRLGGSTSPPRGLEEEPTSERRSRHGAIQRRGGSGVLLLVCPLLFEQRLHDVFVAVTPNGMRLLHQFVG